MAKIKGLLSWIILIIVVIAGLIVGRSIWQSLKDTRAELEAQRAKMTELVKEDSLLRAYSDSLDNENAKLRQIEAQLAEERDRLTNKLKRLEYEHKKVLARLDTMWEAKSVQTELDAAFPEWKGQFWEAQRSDGIHGLIVPRFFGAQAAEVKNKFDKSEKELAAKDRIISNYDSALTVKDSRINNLTLKADSLRSQYDKVFAEYGILDEKYTDLLKRKWFTLHLGPGNIISAGTGFGIGYLVGKNQ